MLKLQKISALSFQKTSALLSTQIPAGIDHEAVGGKCGVGQGFREQGRSGNRLGKLAGIGAEIAPDGDICPIEAPAVGKKLRVIGDEQLEIAPFEDVASSAQSDQAAIEVQDGVFVH